MLEATPASKSFKAALLIVAAVYLGYGIYWAVNGAIWAKTVIQMYGFIVSGQSVGGLSQLTGSQTVLVLIQESCSAANSFVLLSGTVFAFAAAILYLKNSRRWLLCLRFTIVLTAVFALLLVPASIHHLAGSALHWQMVSVYVGLSYLIQALLIAPPLFALNRELGNQKEPRQTRKWIAIAAPMFVFALWFKYLMLWWDTLLPMGPAQLNAWGVIGAVNSGVTLIGAGAVTVYVALRMYRGNKINLKGIGAALALLGCFFVVDTVVALNVPIYASFWYLTDFWMLTLSVLGAAVLAAKTTKPTGQPTSVSVSC